MRPKLKRCHLKDEGQVATVSAMPVACYECGIVEDSREDIRTKEDWSGTGCVLWCHDPCGEIIFDDTELNCAQKL